MPVYVYHCDACGQEFEATQRMSDPPLTECECGEKGQVRRLLSTGAGVIFKGSGFYQTDYKGKNASAPAASTESKAESSAPTGHTCGSPSCCQKKAD